MNESLYAYFVLKRFNIRDIIAEYFFKIVLIMYHNS